MCFIKGRVLVTFLAILFCLVALIKSALILYYPKQFHHFTFAMIKHIDVKKISNYLMIAISVVLLLLMFTGNATTVLASGWFWIPFCALFFLPMIDLEAWDSSGKASNLQKSFTQQRVLFYFLMIISALCLLHGFTVL